MTVADLRTDSPRWPRCDAGYGALPGRDRRLVDAVDATRALGVVAGRDDEAADAVAAIARSYPEATIAVAVPTGELLNRIERHLRPAVDEPLGRYAARRRVAGRVAVGLVGQLPRGTRGGCDVLVLPYAEATLGDAAIREALSGHYRRVVAVARSRRVRDENVGWRLDVVTGGV